MDSHSFYSRAQYNGNCCECILNQRGCSFTKYLIISRALGLALVLVALLLLLLLLPPFLLALLHTSLALFALLRLFLCLVAREILCAS